MTKLLMVVQLGSAVLLVVSILLQQRGEGLSSGIAGGSMEYSTKRGVEKGLFYGSIALAALFLGSSIARLVLGA